MKKIETISKYLSEMFPNPKCELSYKTSWQLLVATILSAQCTDRQVNKVTPKLFQKYPNVQSMSKAKIETIEKLIYSTGFYRNKAKNIIAASDMIMQEFNGKIPKNMENLLRLPGVARKTANIILGECFGIQAGIAVDTHVKRISRKLALSKENTPEKIEKDLMNIFPKKEWTNFSHRLILFGRNICNAKKPNCQICKIHKYCLYYKDIEN